MKTFLGIVIWQIITFAAAFIGSRFMPGEWYAQIAKPSWNPPNWIFGPVWTILYFLMAIAAWLVWRKNGLAGAKLPLCLFIIQLALNAMWSWLFFGLHNPGAAFVDIIVLWIFILATLLSFLPHSRLAGMLMIPYLAWVSFATVLNFTIWQLNIP